MLLNNEDPTKEEFPILDPVAGWQAAAGECPEETAGDLGGIRKLQQGQMTKCISSHQQRGAIKGQSKTGKLELEKDQDFRRLYEREAQVQGVPEFDLLVDIVSMGNKPQDQSELKVCPEMTQQARSQEVCCLHHELEERVQLYQVHPGGGNLGAVGYSRALHDEKPVTVQDEDTVWQDEGDHDQQVGQGVQWLVM